MHYLEVIFVGAGQESCPGSSEVSYQQQEEEGGMVGEDMVKDSQPLILGDHLREQSLEDGPGIQLETHNKQVKSFIAKRVKRHFWHF